MLSFTLYKLKKNLKNAMELWSRNNKKENNSNKIFGVIMLALTNSIIRSWKNSPLEKGRLVSTVHTGLLNPHIKGEKDLSIFTFKTWQHSHHINCEFFQILYSINQPPHYCNGIVKSKQR